jgi:DHA2 family methylenomycin A resistance protein-like MFS transporter
VRSSGKVRYLGGPDVQMSELINDTWSNPHERAAVFGVWAALGGMAMASGPMVGGILIGLIGWRSIFLVNVPICLAGVVLALRIPVVTHEPLPGSTRAFDLAGQIAAIVALALLNVSVIALPHYGWNSFAVIGSLMVAFAGAAAFVVIEANSAQPMLPLDLFRNPLFSGAVWVSMVSAFTFYGLMFHLSLLFQRTFQYTPLRTGLAFLPLTIVVPIGSLLSKRAAGWLGGKWAVVGACLLAASGYFALAVIGPSAPYALFALPLPAIGLAVSLVTPLTTAAMMTSVERSRAGRAAGALNAARQTGALLGVAWSGTWIAGRPRTGEGMSSGFLIAGVLSICACAIWWHVSKQSESRDRLLPEAILPRP